jgi:excinuclease ABC subunit B
MAPFELHADFKPTGDQPDAITQLVTGINRGDKHQVLLGATGTGKSLGHADPVFIIEERDGERRARVVPIGELIDAAFEQYPTDEADGTQVLDAGTMAAKYFIQAFDPAMCQVDLFPVRSFIRHAAPNEMYRLETACGRAATLTGDHNLWVLRDGRLQLIKTAEARPSDYLPIPEALLESGQSPSPVSVDRSVRMSALLEAAQASLEQIMVLETRQPNANLRPASPTRMTALLESAEARLEQIRSLAAGQTNSRSSQDWAGRMPALLDAARASLEQMRSLAVRPVSSGSAPERTAGMAALLEAARASLERITSQSGATGGPTTGGPTGAQAGYAGGQVAVRGPAAGLDRRWQVDVTPAARSAARAATAPAQPALPPDIWPLAGSYLGAGSRSAQAPVDERLERLCGGAPAARHLPELWPDLPEAILAQLLRGFFDAAGKLGRANEITAVVASARLASDLGYALLRFGIWARVTPRKPSARSAKAGAPRYRVSISGQSELRRFNHEIRFGVAVKQAVLQQRVLGQHPDRREVDTLPIVGQELRGLRVGVDLSARELAAGSYLGLSALRSFETGRRAPGRVNMLRMLAALACQAQAVQQFSPEWWQAWDGLHQLCRMRWTPVASVQAVEYSEAFVYDLSVPGPETFLAGGGGFFVHNTFTIANVVAQVQKPTLVMAHNKTLAAQLYAEFKDFFPKNAVEYFVSYYDYYQPEAYVARHDLYIEKETEINEEIDRLRLAATAALLSRRDVLIVSSVSCIYGLGSPDAWRKYMVPLRLGQAFRRTTLLRQLVTIQYERNDVEVRTGVFRVRGDTLEIMPVGQTNAFRIAFFGDDIERIVEYDNLTGEIIGDRQTLDIYPARHFITEEEKLRAAIHDIETELEQRITYFKENNQLLEAQRIEQRTRYDLEMLREVGYCSGIENYSRPLDQRPAGSSPTTLIDYFPPDFLLVIDESHMSVPQIGGMFGGDRSRKEELVKYGFRLPSALDNRPLSFQEFEQRVGQVLYTSATPGPYEMQRASQVVQQVIRPTGLVDPQVEVRPTKGQIDDLVGEVRSRVERGERVLITTLTKRMAEDLADYLLELGLKVHYLHSEIQTFERIEILRDLRLGVFDVVVGINLLREGLDLPEVSLVAILDADKEGFLRSGTSLIQTIGRAARHVQGRVLMYADKTTDSMLHAIDETNRRRAVQVAYNNEHGIVPAGIVKSVRDLTARLRAVAEARADYHTGTAAQLPKDELARLLKDLEKQMKEAAQQLEFEKAALLRDQIFELRQTLVETDKSIPEWQKAQRLAEMEH